MQISSEATLTVQDTDLSTIHRGMNEQFPLVLAEYLKSNDIDPTIYTHEGRKYFYSTVGMEVLDKDTVGQAELAKCELVPGFYSVKPSFAFSSSKLYEEGNILPMDIGSGLAVHFLELKSGDNVLDLCCAPGGKMVLAGLLMGRDFNAKEPEANGSLTGVDIAAHRLAICRSLLKKYKVPRSRLFCADGTCFDESVLKFTRSTPSQRPKAFHETTDYRKRPSRETEELYDKVLVDAQCTHDGSTKHIRKHMQVNWEGFDLVQFIPERLEKLYELQLNLLENGFKMLKVGGTIIYSTCSLSRQQNEDIVAKFLRRNCHAIPYEFEDGMYFKTMSPPKFDSGFFISRFRKI